MSDPSDPGTLARTLGRFVRWITSSKRNSGLVVGVALLIGLTSLLYGKSIRVDTDLRALLPNTAPSVAALDELEARSGGSERFIVAIEASTPDDADAMAANILSVLKSDRTRMGEIAQAHARQYSWDRSMTDLFTSLYPKAFRRAWARSTQPATGIRHALADA